MGSIMRQGGGLGPWSGLHSRERKLKERIKALIRLWLKAKWFASHRNRWLEGKDFLTSAF